MAITSSSAASGSSADQRKFRCLVAELKKAGVFKLEDVHKLSGPIRGTPCNILERAMAAAKKAATPKWLKGLQSAIEGDAWSPPSREWRSFEEMRATNLQGSYVNGNTCLIWSPVEVWLRLHRGRSHELHHVISLLTGESVYVYDYTVMYPADGSYDFPITRSMHSIPPANIEDKFPILKAVPATPLIRAICEL